MSTQFFRDGRWLTLSQMKEYNEAKIKPKSVKKEETEIVHEVTEEEVKENGLEEVLEPGDKIGIPVEEEVKPKAKKSNKK